MSIAARCPAAAEREAAGDSMRRVTDATEVVEQPRGGRMPRNERRVQLLESALQVFVAQGYHAAAMDDIAERAGVSKPVLYQHFPGKLELYVALLDVACDEAVASVRSALASTTDNQERVAASTEAFYAYVADPAAAFRLVFESDLTNEPEVRKRIERVTVECAEAIAEVIADDTGLPRDVARLLAVALVGMSHVSARFWLESEPDMPQSQATQLISRLAWRGIRGFPRHE
jgi:AcrR family transcriptional regulator